MLDYKLKEKLRRKILKATGKAVVDFNMIEPGDRIMVCLSGGKDSWTLLETLATIKKKAPFSFSLTAVNIDPNYAGYETHKIKEYCDKHGFECRIEKTQIQQIIEQYNTPGKSLCSFCARLKRGNIYSVAKEMGITKIALGHHRDDLNETLLMNLFFSGQLKAMSPKYTTDDGAHVIIRPMIYVSEDDIRDYATGRFPLIYCSCPVANAEDHQRKQMKQLLKDLAKTTPDVESTMLNALTNVVPSHLLDRDLHEF